MKTTYSMIVGLVALCAVSAVSADQKTICQNGEQVREIHILYAEEGQPVPCTVEYVKDGNQQTLWRADAEVGYCEEQAQAFITKQENWGWQCAEETAEVMSSGEPDA